MHSFFIIGSGSVLKSTIGEILKNKGVIKTIYVDNARDEKRYSKVYRTKDIICLEDDSGFLANSIDEFTWLISADNKKIINKNPNV